MRLVTIILITTMVQVSAATFGQKLTLVKERVTLDQVFSEIRKQTGYDVLIVSDQLKGSMRINAKFNNAPLNEVMESVLDKKPLSFTIEDKTIVIGAKKDSYLDKAKSVLDRGIRKLFQQTDVRGKVADENGEPLAGASVMVKGTAKATKTNNEGRFILTGVDEKAVIVISFIGYQTLEVTAKADLGDIRIKIGSGELDEVEVVVNTGYQTLPKERATGSFELIDEKMLNTRTGSNLLERLEGLVPGLQFDRRTNGPEFNIRGISSMSSTMMAPLIILDNFPYQGDLSNINPNDIESVTVLKDAAAASIWGARAGNGVLVITTKTAAKRDKVRLEYSTNLNVTERPNLLYHPNISTSDFIDVEQFLFDKGHYNASYNGIPRTKNTTIFSPVVELLYKQQDGLISQDEASRLIERYRGIDFRHEMMDLFYQSPFMQQHYLGFSGQSGNLSSRLSVGYDHETGNQVGSKNNRLTLRTVNKLELGKKVSVEGRLSYTNARGSSYTDIMNYEYNVGGTRARLYPYAQFTGENNQPLPIPNQYNMNYVSGLQNSRLLNWMYYPSDEIGTTVSSGIRQHIQAQLALDYRPVNGLGINVTYNMTNEPSGFDILHRENAFFTRNLVNRFTQINGETLKYIIPPGGIKNSNTTKIWGHNVRGSANYQKRFSNQHDLSLLAGGELTDRQSGTNGFRVYGYDEYLMLSQVVDLVNTYPIYDGLAGNSRIPSAGGESLRTDRFLSAFINMGYTYLDRYGLSLSARRDASNLFGVRTNDKWNPLWSAGLSWQIHREDFVQKVSWIDMIKLRATIGHSGNSGGAANLLPIIGYQTPSISSITTLPRAQVTTLSNPNLRWEDVRTINVGIDFGFWKNSISGSFEVYDKKSTDLLSADRLDITTGYTTIQRNVAELKGRGIDARLSGNYGSGRISGRSTLNLSYNRTSVEKFFGTAFTGSTYAENTGRNLNPVVGNDVFSVYAYSFAGLDPNTGDPQGLINGNVSKNYAQLLRDSVQNLQYYGTALPPIHGSLIQELTWNKLTISFLLAFKFGHYFQKPTIMYNNLMNTWVGHNDYARRWKTPGDEAHTTVPSMVYPASQDRDRFYASSEANILKAGLIRLQDVSLSYRWDRRLLNRNVLGNIFFKINNAGLLWTANKHGLDPDYLALPPGIRYSLGINVNL